MNSQRLCYFAYGSNMNPRRMESRGVEVYSMKSAYLNDYELAFNKLSSSLRGEGFANIRTNPQSRVEGILYEINATGMANLDYYEKYPFEYDRIMFEVVHSGSENIMAYAYIAQPGRMAPSLKPRRNYLNHLLSAEGYLSTEYIARLNNIVTLD